MEKYARQALSEGIKSADDLHVTDDCELLRVLNLHYNRSNHIAVSFSFSINQFYPYYFSLALIPFIVGLSFGCMGFFFILGFLANAAIAALYGKIVLGRK